MAALKSYHHGDLRAEIIRIADEHVAASGVDRLSLRACARSANVDPAAVYRHFKSKDAIIAALSRQAFSALAQCLEEAEAAAAGQGQNEILRHIGLAYVAFATENPRHFPMMFEAAGRLPIKEVGGVGTSGRNAYQILQAAMGGLRPDQGQEALDSRAFTLWSAVHGMSSLFNAGLGPQTRQAQRARADEVCRTVLSGWTLASQGTASNG